MIRHITYISNKRALAALDSRHPSSGLGEATSQPDDSQRPPSSSQLKKLHIPPVRPLSTLSRSHSYPSLPTERVERRTSALSSPTSPENATAFISPCGGPKVSPLSVHSRYRSRPLTERYDATSCSDRSVVAEIYCPPVLVNGGAAHAAGSTLCC